jgi:hypothetical protein
MIRSPVSLTTTSVLLIETMLLILSVRENVESWIKSFDRVCCIQSHCPPVFWNSFHHQFAGASTLLHSIGPRSMAFSRTAESGQTRRSQSAFVSLKKIPGF